MSVARSSSRTGRRRSYQPEAQKSSELREFFLEFNSLRRCRRDQAPQTWPSTVVAASRAENRLWTGWAPDGHRSRCDRPDWPPACAHSGARKKDETSGKERAARASEASENLKQPWSISHGCPRLGG